LDGLPQVEEILHSKGQTHYFRSKACKDNFVKDPQTYLGQ
jgi:YHS domain-containing protein